MAGVGEEPGRQWGGVTGGGGREDWGVLGSPGARGGRGSGQVWDELRQGTALAAPGLPRGHGSRAGRRARCGAGGPRQAVAGRGEPRACGACSRERFLSETKAYFFRRDGLCSYLMTSPWPGAQSRRPGGLAAGGSNPLPRGPRGRPYLVPDIKAGAFHERMQTAQRRPPGQLAPGRAGGLSEGGRAPPASAAQTP